MQDAKTAPLESRKRFATAVLLCLSVAVATVPSSCTSSWSRPADPSTISQPTGTYMERPGSRGTPSAQDNTQLRQIRRLPNHVTEKVKTRGQNKSCYVRILHYAIRTAHARHHDAAIAPFRWRPIRRRGDQLLHARIEDRLEVVAEGVLHAAALAVRRGEDHGSSFSLQSE